MKLAGHLARHDELLAHKLLFWEPTHGKRSVGRPKLTYRDILCRDTEMEDVNDVRSMMLDRSLWRSFIDTRPKKSP